MIFFEGKHILAEKGSYAHLEVAEDLLLAAHEILFSRTPSSEYVLTRFVKILSRENTSTLRYSQTIGAHRCDFLKKISFFSERIPPFSRSCSPTKTIIPQNL